MLEALSLLAPGRGLINSPSHLLPRHGTNEWGVSATLKRGGDRFNLSTGSVEGKGRRSFLLEGEKVRTQSDIAPLYACVWLTPQMDRLFHESAAGRRRFLDRLTVALVPGHAQQLMAHERSVMSRNRVLLEQPHETIWLDSLEDSISRHAVAATAARLNLIESLHNMPFGNEDFPQTIFQLNCPIARQLNQMPALQVEDALRKELKRTRHHDQMRKSTSIGAHKADFTLLDKNSQRDATHSSSGQKKIMLLSVILSHAHCITRAWGEAPVILLDEPLTHLDEKRRTVLMESLLALNTTTLLTGTEDDLFSPLKGSAEFLHISNGTLSYAS